ncbi:MAG: hypothetical protein ABJB05_15315 [Parafilimonas sp.]
MSYSTKDRNAAIMRIAAGNADLNNVNFYEELESFNWITIKRVNGTINSVQLTYAGKDLNRRLMKNSTL